VNRINPACNPLPQLRNGRETAAKSEFSQKALGYRPLEILKLCFSNFSSDPAILHESNKDFISPAVDFAPN
jgi:hypothetical protein